MPIEDQPVDPVERASLIVTLTEPGHRTEAHATLLVDAMLGKPNPLITWQAMDGRMVRRKVEDGLLLERRTRFGWVQQNGTWLGCGHAAHYLVVFAFGMSEGEADKAGWARVTPHGVRSTYRLTRAQLDVLKSKGHEVDLAAQVLKPRLGDGTSLSGYAELARSDPESSDSTPRW